MSQTQQVKYDYWGYQGHTVRLVIETDNRLSLEVDLTSGDSNEFQREALNYLKAEIEKLYKEKVKVINQNGDTLHLEGFPIWGPHDEYGPNGHKVRLLFGNNAKVSDKHIYAKGEKDRPTGYYPYQL
ncbi:MAG: hypothetical protein JNK33_00525 [Candidatus Doudnabacteria bacterium]|nr:hypothetical protein [Candidatus Doudnabacteria bacterium]